MIVKIFEFLGLIIIFLWLFLTWPFCLCICLIYTFPSFLKIYYSKKFVRHIWQWLPFHTTRTLLYELVRIIKIDNILINWWVYIDRVSYFYSLLKTSFSELMQIWQLFMILKQPVHISVTVFYNLTKLTNYLFIFTIQIQTGII